MSLLWLMRRLLLIAYTMIVVSVVVFAITEALPADAATMILGQNATPAALAALRARLGLDAPVWLQYWRWVWPALHGNFGISMRTNLPVAPAMLAALSRSLMLAAAAILLMLLIAVPLGLAAALGRSGPIDLIAGLVSYLGVSLPEFVTATMLLILFADRLGWLPATGYVSPARHLVDGVRHLVLPVVTVALVMVAHVVRMLRSETIDVMASDYIRAAHLKGLPPRVVLFRHALRNALLPVITVVALDVGYVLGGIIVVEQIFAIPGIGRALIVAIQSRDLPSIQAGALMMAGTYAVVNLLSDIAYALLDKRIRYE
ncbi:MAG: ABC transporter permease [Rhodospirillales bacterium]|nr:ABC transporter permease [Rhodospirillales bacterium]